MSTHAADLGRFAPDQGPTSLWSAAAVALGASAAAVAAVAIVTDLSGGASFDSRPSAAPLGVLAIVAAVVGMLQAATSGRRGRGLAGWGAALGAAGAVAAILHGASLAGTLDFGAFGTAYFDRDIISATWPDLRRAAVNTLKYAAVAEGFGIVLGLIVATMAISKRAFLRVPAVVYVDVVRGLPLLMTIFLVAFAPTYIGITFPTILAGIVALTINSSAYVAEIFRAGIQAVERGQMDAARSLGMPYAIAMTTVIIPQAFRKVIPPLMNEFIALVKDTSLLLAIGFTAVERELLAAARQLQSSTASATPYMLASLLYLSITVPLTRIVNRLERRINRAEPLRPREPLAVKGAGSG